MQWFRFYSSVVHDPKVGTLPVEVKWGWVCLLCLANDGKPRGRLPSLSHVAFALHTTESEARKLIEVLTDAGLLDEDADGNITPHNWEGRQHKSDDVSERVRRHRERRAETCQETKPKRRCNVSVTPPDTDTDTDTELTPPTPPKGGTTTGGAANGNGRLRSDGGPKATPGQVSRLVAWAREVLGDRGELEDFGGKVPGFCASYPPDWVEGAVLVAAVNAKPGGLAQYVNGCLLRWFSAGRPNYEEVEAARRSARPEAAAASAADLDEITRRVLAKEGSLV